MPKRFAGEHFPALFPKISGSEKVRDKTGSIKIFRRKFFVSQCRNPSQVNSSVLCSRKNPVAKRFMDKGGEYEDFPSEILSLTVAKIFIGESFTLGVFLGTGKVWITRGGVGVSRCSFDKNLSHSAKVFRRVIVSCCINFGYRKGLDEWGSIKIFRRRIFVSQCRKCS